MHLCSIVHRGWQQRVTHEHGKSCDISMTSAVVCVWETDNTDLWLVLVLDESVMFLNDMFRPVAQPEVTAVTTQVLEPESDSVSCFSVLRSGIEQTHVVEIQVDHLCSPPQILIRNLEWIEEDQEYMRQVVGLDTIMQRGGTWQAGKCVGKKLCAFFS